MKIAIVISGPFAANGICRVAESWARILASAGHRTAVVFEAGEEGLELPPCERIPYPAKPTVARIGRPLGRSREAVCALREVDERSGIDLNRKMLSEIAIADFDTFREIAAFAAKA